MPRGKISGRAGGKLIDTWYYQYEGVEMQEQTRKTAAAEEEGLEADEAIQRDLRSSATQIKVAVKVFLHKKFQESDAPPLATKEVWFTVECEKPEFTLEGPDIEALRAAMWEKLDDHFKVKWERYYKVQMSPGYGSGYGLQFEYASIDKGTAWDGTLLMREYEYRNGRVIRPWPGEFRDGQGMLLACIPATPENTRYLQEFGERIGALRRVLADFLRPDVIMKTLMNLNSVGLLPRAEEIDKGGQNND